MILLKICWHYSNVPMNSVYVVKFIANIGKHANVTNDVRNNRNTVAFEKWDLVPSHNRSLFNYSVQIKYETSNGVIFQLDPYK